MRTRRVMIREKFFDERINERVVIKNDVTFSNRWAPSEADRQEREYWKSKAKDAIEIFKENGNLFSRQACFSNTYQGLGAQTQCISLIHFYVFGCKIEMNVYQRSCNLDKNFTYDANTYVLLRDIVAKAMKFDKGNINWHIFSLHRIVK